MTYRARFSRLSALALLAMLGACGGGGSDGTTPTPTTPGPAPTTPGPAPTTPPPAPTGTRFTASGVGPLAGTVFIDSNNNGIIDNGEGQTTTNLFGEFGQGVVGMLPPGGPAPTTATVRFQAVGVDTATGFIVSSLRAPAGASVLSPITTIIDLVGDQARVRRAFGLSDVGVAIRESTDLLHFDAAQKLDSADLVTAREAARVTAINFRIVALMRLLSRFDGDPVDVGSGASEEGARYLAEVINETGSADLSNREVVLSALLKGNNFYRLQREQLEIAAETFAKFMSIVPAYIEDLPTAFRYELAFRFYAFAQIKNVYAVYPSAEAERVRALTVSDMQDALARFADTPRPIAGNYFMALPDYREIRTRGVVILDPPTTNDVSAPPYGVGNFSKEILSVSVSPLFDGRVVVQLTEGQIRVAPDPSFSGYAYFDYRARSGSQESTARVHLLVAPR